MDGSAGKPKSGLDGAKRSAFAPNCAKIAPVYPNVVTMRGQQKAKDGQGEPRSAMESPGGRRRAPMRGNKGPRYTKLGRYIAKRDQDDTEGSPMRGQQGAKESFGDRRRGPMSGKEGAGYPKLGQDSAKRSQDGTKLSRDGTRLHQEATRLKQDATKLSQDGDNLGRDSARRSQDGTKGSQR